MPFKRYVPDATQRFLYVSSQDSALTPPDMADHLDAAREWQQSDEGVGFSADQYATWEEFTAGLDLPSDVLDSVDPNLPVNAATLGKLIEKRATLDVALERAKLKAFAASVMGTKAAKKVGLTENAVMSLGTIDTALGHVQDALTVARGQLYRESGDTTLLGIPEGGEQPFVWELHNLSNPQMARVRGLLQEPDPALTEHENGYSVGCEVLRMVVTGCRGWDAYKNDTDGHISRETIAMIPDVVVIELSGFVIDLPNLTGYEAKA